MNNLDKMFDINVRIENQDPMNADAIWPHGIEICICRFPVRKKDGYTDELLQEFAKKLKTHIVKNGIVFLVCYAPTEAKFRPFEIAKTMVDEGFTHIDNIIIEKSWFPGKRSEINLINSHEYVLYFCNGDVWKLDRAPLREYLKIEDMNKCPGNLWKIEIGSLEESIPYDLAKLLIQLTDILPGSQIFDPFMGNTSTFRASIELGHSFIGFEHDNKKYTKYQKVLNNLQK